MTSALENGMRGFENIAVTLMEAIFGEDPPLPSTESPSLIEFGVPIPQQGEHCPIASSRPLLDKDA